MAGGGNITLMQLLNPDNYVLTVHAKLSLFVGAAIAVLGLYILIRERGSHGSVFFWFFTLCVSIWLPAFGAMYASLQEQQALLWQRIAQIGVTFIPAAILLLAFAVAQRPRQFRTIIRASIAASMLFCFGALFTDLHIKGLYHYYWGYYPQFGPLGAAFVVYFGVVMVYVVRLYWIEYRLSTNERRRRRFKGLLIAFSIGYLASADFLPAFGVPLYPYGYIPMFLFLCITAYVITRYKLIDITPELAAGQVLETMHGAVIVADLEGKVRVINRAAQVMLGRESEDILEQDLSSIIELPGNLKDHGRLRQGSILNHEMVWTIKDGQLIDISVSASLMTEKDSSLIGIVYVVYDITERKKGELRLQQLALYDTLTGLPNRILFFDRMNQLLALAKRNQYVLALLYMDLDDFKAINDKFGHETGDLLLQEAAQRMLSCTRKADTIARMGGDEFIGICGRIAFPEDAAVIARKIMAVLADPFTLKGKECSIGVSIGISLYPADGEELGQLIKKADTAMYRVKHTGKGGYAYFSPPRTSEERL